MSLALARALRQPVPIRRTYSTRIRAVGRGQNLSDRYIRLEKSLREKQALRDGLEQLEGLVVPDKPRPPESDECCMSGCAICVYDVYEESLDVYQEKIAELTTQLTAMGYPEKSGPVERKQNVTLNVFEEMERALKQHSQRYDYERPAASRPPPPKLSDNLREIKEGLTWIVFGNR
ncbi:hypothetical protein BDZ89DRAFT_1062527 [Hymenopellis radicata]|nr:hypothetical protein BDZ89DRAFT_1062527 [Hymenopellis radicata]